jgi:hypothetical protein
MEQKALEVLIHDFHSKIAALEQSIIDLNIALQGTSNKRTTITFHSNPNRKIEDTSVLKKIEGGINEII